MTKWIYAPEGVDKPREWEFDVEKMLNTDAIAIEKVTGMTTLEWGNALARGSFTALTALLWLLLRRDQPTLELDAVQFRLDEFYVEGDEPDADQSGAGDEAEGEAPKEEPALVSSGSASTAGTSPTF